MSGDRNPISFDDLPVLKNIGGEIDAHRFKARATQGCVSAPRPGVVAKIKNFAARKISGPIGTICK
jgi:hypothetical protein